MNTNTVSQNIDDRSVTSDRFDRLFWKRLSRLIRPYWTSERRPRALRLITVMTALSLGTVGMQAIFSYVSRDVMNALQAKDAARFYHLMMLFGLWIVLFVPIAAIYPYLTGLLGIDWREWMTGVIRATDAAAQLALPHHARPYGGQSRSAHQRGRQQFHQRRAQLLDDGAAGDRNWR